jgi:hypothetical protein
VGRSPHRNDFAANDTAPLPASTGRTVDIASLPPRENRLVIGRYTIAITRSAVTPKAAPTTNAIAAPVRPAEKPCAVSREAFRHGVHRHTATPPAAPPDPRTRLCLS